MDRLKLISFLILVPLAAMAQHYPLEYLNLDSLGIHIGADSQSCLVETTDSTSCEEIKQAFKLAMIHLQEYRERYTAEATFEAYIAPDSAELLRKWSFEEHTIEVLSRSYSDSMTSYTLSVRYPTAEGFAQLADYKEIFDLYIKDSSATSVVLSALEAKDDDDIPLEKYGGTTIIDRNNIKFIHFKRFPYFKDGKRELAYELSEVIYRVDEGGKVTVVSSK